MQVMGCEDKELDHQSPQWGCAGFNPGRRVGGTVVPMAAATPRGPSPHQMDPCPRCLPDRECCGTPQLSAPFSHHQFISWCPVLLCKAAALPRAPQVKRPAAPGLGSDRGSLPHCMWPNHPGASYAKTESISYVFHGLYDVSGNSLISSAEDFTSASQIAKYPT